MSSYNLSRKQLAAQIMHVRKHMAGNYLTIYRGEDKHVAYPQDTARLDH